MSAPVYDAFISYRHLTLDKAVARKLHTLLENYKIPGSVQKISGKKKMGRVFRDEEELPLATSLSDNIEAALRNSRWLIVICTPALLESRWCMREIDYFISLGRRDRILLVLADGTAEMSFPKQLRYKEENGVLKECEPLAANIVGESMQQSLKKLKAEKLRILAPMLGVGFDDLRRRAHQRKVKIAAAIASAVLVAGAATAFFLIRNAKKQEELRRAAEEQQRIAAEQASIAEEERRIAAEQQALAEQQSREAAEQQRIAEEERKRAEEERRIAEEKKRQAAENSIGELLERAAAALGKNERIAAAKSLQEALSVSEEYEDLRRDEIISLARKVLYIPPYTVLAGFENQNVRLLNLVPSPTGPLVLGVVNDNSAALADLSTNEILYQVSAGNKQLLGLCFSPDGSRFLANCEDGLEICVWDTASGERLYTYVSKKNQSFAIPNAFFLKDADTVLIQDWDQLYLVSLTDGSEKLLYTIGDQQDGYDPYDNLLTRGLGKPISEAITLYNDDYVGTELLVSDDFSKILVGGRDGSTGMILIDTEGNRICLLEDMPAVFSEQYAISPDGKTVSCTSYFGFFASWDAESGQLLYAYQLNSDRGFSFSNIAYSPDSRQMAFVLNDFLYAMDVSSAYLLFGGQMDENNITPEVRYSTDGRTLYVTHQNLYLIDVATGTLLRSMESGFTSAYNNIVPMGDRIFISRNDGSAALYSSPAFASVQTSSSFDGELCEPYDPGYVVVAGVPTLMSEHKLTDAFKLSVGSSLGDMNPQLFVSREKDRLALGFADGVIELFDAAGDGSVQKMISQLTIKPSALGIAGGILAASDVNGRLLFYDISEDKVINIIPRGSSYVAFAFSADADKLIALDQNERTADVYDLRDGTLLFSMESSSRIVRIAFSADGAFAVAETENGVLTGDLWQYEEALLNQLNRLSGN
ncbi:MAG: TIR domain-containing protein [Lachnospiraceae bacterium]|nr:TIR domain-containing protein [Lachnospiraceae bacterium]